MRKCTELVFIIDRSGSMSGLEKDTIGGFNSLIEKQKKEEGECFVSAVLFNDESFLAYDRVDIGEIEPMTEKQYFTCGSTALLDALGSAIEHISDIHADMGKENRPEKTLFVIITDGEENSSTQFSFAEIKKLVSKHKEKYDWEFLFIGANMDAIKEAAKYGIDESRAVEYKCDKMGTEVSYAAVGEAVKSFRSGNAIDDDWCCKIAEDRKKVR